VVELLTVKLLLREDVEPRRLEDLTTELVLVLAKPADGVPGRRVELLAVQFALTGDLTELSKSGRGEQRRQSREKRRKGIPNVLIFALRKAKLETLSLAVDTLELVAILLNRCSDFILLVRLLVLLVRTVSVARGGRKERKEGSVQFDEGCLACQAPEARCR